jgi:hypothetical protein
MEDIIEWLETTGNQIIYLYGEQDPWTAAAIGEPTLTNAVRIVQPEANHQLRIVNLDERERVVAALEEWLDLDIDIPEMAVEPGTDPENPNQIRDLPARHNLYQNYPNPFNPVSTIGFDLPYASDVSLTVHDIMGREVIKLVDGRLAAGYHRVIWDASKEAAGIYIAKLQTSTASWSIKMVLLK